MYEDKTVSELLEIYRNGSPREKTLAMNQIVMGNDNLIIHIINKFFFSYKSKHMEDMRQEGREALFRHVVNYDETRGKFSTYITPYIIDAIKNYVCSMHEISTHYASQLKRYHKALAALSQRSIENPTLGDIADEMEVGLDAAQRVMEIAQHLNPISLEGDEKDKELTSAYSSSPDAVYEQKEFHERIGKAIASLSEAERTVIKLSYFSDKSGKEVPLADIASTMGKDVSAVRRLKNLALRKLQESPYLADFSASKQRRKLEDYAEGLQISFAIPASVVDCNISIALSLEDDE